MEAGTLPPENTLTVGRTDGGLDARKYSNSWTEVYNGLPHQEIIPYLTLTLTVDQI